MKFKDHLALYILAPLCVVSLALSFDRFMLKNDYIVQYDGVCDPLTQECFVSCEDDDCQEESYYMKVQKFEKDIRAECGQDVTDCEDANICLPTDTVCTIKYCSPDTISNDESCEDIDSTANLDDSETSIEGGDVTPPTNEKTP